VVPATFRRRSPAERFGDALYPPLVRTMGGREKAVGAIRGEMDKMRSLAMATS
jgi:hypothetical protein